MYVQAIHMYYMCETCVIVVFYTCITNGLHIINIWHIYQCMCIRNKINIFNIRGTNNESILKITFQISYYTLYSHDILQNTHLVYEIRFSRDSIKWLYSCNQSSYIRPVYSQCHVLLLKCTEQNVNNQTLTQVSQLYVLVLICLKVLGPCLNMLTGGHGHMICMDVLAGN